MSALKLVDAHKTLKNASTIAIVGCSPDPYRTSNYAANYLKESGYKIIPINPKVKEILGETCYPDLNSIPKDVQLDIVNVFRNKIYTAEVANDVVTWKDRTGQNPVLWTQLDVSSKEAELIAEQNEIPYVRNTCIMVVLDHLKAE